MTVVASSASVDPFSSSTFGLSIISRLLLQDLVATPSCCEGIQVERRDDSAASCIETVTVERKLLTNER